MTSPSRASLRNSIIHACCFSVLGSAAAGAEEPADKEGSVLEVVTVTADKREMSLQHVPISVAALTGESLAELGATSINDYFKFVPGINFSPGAFGDRGGQNIVIRGVSNTRLVGVDAAASAATTSFYINEIPVTLLDPALYDINRVEVLKGPQGTLFGAASMGGTVRIITNRADPNDWAGSVDATAQSRDGGIGYRVNAMVNVPLVADVLAARLVAYSKYDDGYTNSIVPPLSDTTQQPYPGLPGYELVDVSTSNSLRTDSNDSRAEGVRVAINFTPSERLQVAATFMHQSQRKDDQDTFDANLRMGFYKKRFLAEPHEQSFDLSSIEASYDFGPVKLVSATGYFQRGYLEVADQTLATFGLFGGTGVTQSCPGGRCIAGTGALATSIDTQSVTQELRLQSTGNTGSPLINRFDWVLGAYYSRETRDGDMLWRVPGFNANAAVPLTTVNDIIFASNWESRDVNKSAFVDAGFHVTDKLRASAGVRRYDQSQQTARDLIGPLQGPAFAVTTNPTFVANDSEGWTPRYTLSYQFSDDVLLYGSAAKGFRAGGGIIPVTEPACIADIARLGLEPFTRGFGPDKLWNYELGTKTTWADGRVTVNAAAYFIKWDELQQGISLAQFSQSNCTRTLTANVGNAEVKGGELEVRAYATDNLLLQSSVAYTNAEISGVDPRSRVGYPGAPMQNVPKWTGMAAIQYTIPTLVLGASGYVRADYAYRSGITTTVGIPSNPLLLLPSYSNVNLRVGVDWNAYNLELFMENSLDSEQLLSAQPGTAGATIRVANYPRTVGVKIGKKF